MTPHPPKQYVDARRGERRHRRAAALTLGGLALAVAIGIGVSVGGQADTEAVSTMPTGEVSDMGMPVIATPGHSTGVAAAGPVEVTGASWELGQVPLDVAVRPTWTLRNTGAEPVVVGQPHPEVREGCCPGAFDIDTTTIEPGGTATLAFELSMHEGMDGWHDIAVHVPLRANGTDHVLELDVTGDFTNA